MKLKAPAHRERARLSIAEAHALVTRQAERLRAMARLAVLRARVRVQGVRREVVAGVDAKRSHRAGVAIGAERLVVAGVA